ncbi:MULTISPECIES: DUF6207 family protein [unclassified Streptomyces]|uniref:DUF6207 family protein n=1 Tax=unclassified Streptomyces TaxID=2593676 RepID=UPI00340AB900
MTSQGAHLTHPGLARITVHSADATTVNAVAHAIADHLNATSPTDPEPLPDEGGVVVHQYVYATPPDDTPQAAGE